MSSTFTLPFIRPPAVPLVTHDPYFSLWSFSSKLTGGWSRHWTDEPQPMLGVAFIDGRPFRFMGKESDQVELHTMEQVSLEVWPLRTIYTFESAGVRLALTFTSPLLPNDLDVFSRPVTYINFEVQPADGAEHDVKIFFSVTTAIAAENGLAEVVWSRYRFGKLAVLSSASAEQRVLDHSGDDLRIEWGRLLLAAASSQADLWTGYMYEALDSVARSGALPDMDDIRMPRAGTDENPHLVALFDLGAVAAEPASRMVMLGYDEPFSIEYLYRKLRPYWRRGGREAGDMLLNAWNEAPGLLEACRKFDLDLVETLVRAGGEQYAVLCALAYRQAMAAHKLVIDQDGTPMLFSKENFSNGCAATVDVTYPSSPIFLLLNPELLKATLSPVLQYASSGRWRFNFAPHDVGRYPLANGQVYGGGERREENQMPVEESGNMLILLAALVQAEGSIDYVRRYWPMLKEWARYLREKGLDPEKQLCTDDFAGYLAHNTNLSLKAIIALAAFARLARLMGEPDTAAEYQAISHEMAREWQAMAFDGDHYRLAFDKPGTWSQKYNLVWDQLLELNLFPPEVAATEIAFYKTMQKTYGLPLDNRKDYTKLDWIVWTATLAKSQEDFAFFVEPLYRWANETKDRVPLADWYYSTDGRHSEFRARSVVGGLFIKALVRHPRFAPSAEPESSEELPAAA